MRVVRIVFLVLASFILCWFVHDMAFGAPKSGAVPTGYDDKGSPIYKLIDLEDVISPTVFNGTKSIEGEFPEVGFLGFCTATAVGPKTIYTAGHCIDNGQKVNWKMRKNQVSYAGSCYKHSQYNDSSAFNDYAFCILDVELPKDTVFASFNISGSPVNGDLALINGFGAPNLGSLFWGQGEVTGMQGQDLVVCKGARLGGGDSGGSFFAWTTDRKDPSKHIINGTNSRASSSCSYFNSTSHQNFIAWAAPFAKDKGLEICGVNKDCISEPIDPNKCKQERGIVDWIKKELGIAELQLKACLSKP